MMKLNQFLKLCVQFCILKHQVMDNVGQFLVTVTISSYGKKKKHVKNGSSYEEILHH